MVERHLRQTPYLLQVVNMPSQEQHLAAYLGQPRQWEAKVGFTAEYKIQQAACKCLGSISVQCILSRWGYSCGKRSRVDIQHSCRDYVGLPSLLPHEAEETRTRLRWLLPLAVHMPAYSCERKLCISAILQRFTVVITSEWGGIWTTECGCC